MFHLHAETNAPIHARFGWGRAPLALRGKSAARRALPVAVSRELDALGRQSARPSIGHGEVCQGRVSRDAPRSREIVPSPPVELAGIGDLGSGARGTNHRHLLGHVLSDLRTMNKIRYREPGWLKYRQKITMDCGATG